MSDTDSKKTSPRRLYGSRRGVVNKQQTTPAESARVVLRLCRDSQLTIASGRGTFHTTAGETICRTIHRRYTSA